MAKVVTQIIDQGTKLELYFSATANVLIDKSAIKLRRTGDILYLYDSSMSDTVIQEGTQREYKLLFASITSPATASAALLEAAIITMLNDSPSEDCCEAVQALLNDILSVDEDTLAEVQAIFLFLANVLDVPLSDLATEATLQDILAQLDVPLSTIATEVTLQSVLSQLDVLNDIATEATLQDVLAQLDVPLSDVAQESTQQDVLANTQILVDRNFNNNLNTYSISTGASAAALKAGLDAVLSGAPTEKFISFSFVNNTTTYEAILITAN